MNKVLIEAKAKEYEKTRKEISELTRIKALAETLIQSMDEGTVSETEYDKILTHIILLSSEYFSFEELKTILIDRQ